MSGLSVRQIKEILDAAGVGYGDCSEKSELEARLKWARSNAKGAGGSGSKEGAPPPRRAAPSSSSSSSSGARQRSSQQSRPSSSRPQAASSGNGPNTPNVATLGKNPDGTDGGDVGKEIRRICALENYYEILSVAKNADASELKKAYRKSAIKLHPDKCDLTGAEAAFQKVSAAFSCLNDADKRRTYDMFGSEQPASAAGGGMGGMGGMDMDANDLFNAFFGGMGGAGGMGGMGGGRRGPGGMQFHFMGPGMGGMGGMPFGNMGGMGGMPFGNMGGMGGQRRGQPQQQQQQQQQQPREAAGGGFLSGIVSTLAGNPFLIITLLICMSSFVTVLGHIANKPYLLILPFLVPAGMRKQAAMVFFALLCSGFI